MVATTVSYLQYLLVDHTSSFQGHVGGGSGLRTRLQLQTADKGW